MYKLSKKCKQLPHLPGLGAKSTPWPVEMLKVSPHLRHAMQSCLCFPSRFRRPFKPAGIHAHHRSTLASTTPHPSPLPSPTPPPTPTPPTSSISAANLLPHSSSISCPSLPTNTACPSFRLFFKCPILANRQCALVIQVILNAGLGVQSRFLVQAGGAMEGSGAEDMRA